MPTISGIVKDAGGNLVSRLVRLYRLDTGALVDQVLSDAATGAWSITTADTAEHFAIRHDTNDVNPYWGKIVLASHFDDSGLADIKGHAVTVNGTVTRSAVQSKFGGYSALFDGSSYLSYANSADWGLINSGDFDLQLWFYGASLSNTAFIGQANGSGSTPKWGLYLNDATTVGSGNVGFHCNDGSAFNVAAAWAPSASAWHLIHASRVGNVWYFIGDGTLLGSVTETRRPSLSSGTLRIGSDGESYRFFSGHIDDVLLTKGAAQAAAGYSLPTGAFKAGPINIVENALVYDLIVPV